MASRRGIGALQRSPRGPRHRRRLATAAPTLPGSVDTVIVGGGCVGLAVAHALAKEGLGDVLLVEREAAVGSVTSSQAAGLVGQMRTGGVDRIKMAMRSVAEFSALQAEPDDAMPRPGWRQVGSLRVAQTAARAEEDVALKAMCDEAGLETHWLTAAEAVERWPGLRFSSTAEASADDTAAPPVHSVLWCPTDGYLQPYDLCTAYQAHARRNGAQFATRSSLEAITLSPDGSRVDGVETSSGAVSCRRVINAAGAHAYHVAKLAMPALDWPLFPVRHASVVTVPFEPEPGVTIEPENPVVRAVDSTLYMRPDVHSLLLGGFEPRGSARSADPAADFAIDEHAPELLAEPDWETLGQFVQGAASLCPAVLEAPVRDVQAGWPCFTPDGRFLIGEASSGPSGFVFASGCNAHGVSGSPALGHFVAEAVLRPATEHSEYLRSLSPDRFEATAAAGQGDAGWGLARTAAQQIYEDYYAPASVC